ncbi:MAG: hypothetical protein OXE85_07090 [Roseovarius sp.]|nr:hypothetical protein [Roseovarius sp.]MCY4317179.1 hypothetical protein [Roseovarius sp.]
MSRVKRAKVITRRDGGTTLEQVLKRRGKAPFASVPQKWRAAIAPHRIEIRRFKRNGLIQDFAATIGAPISTPTEMDRLLDLSFKAERRGFAPWRRKPASLPKPPQPTCELLAWIAQQSMDGPFRLKKTFFGNECSRFDRRAQMGPIPGVKARAKE